MKEQTIYIIGAGAIGKALAVFLQHARKKVVLIRGSVDDVPEQHETISIVLNNGSTVTETILVRSLNHFQQFDGIVVLANKSFGNEALSQRLKEKTGQSPLVVMQNGLDVEKSFLDNGYPHVYRCVLFSTCQPVQAGVLRFKPVMDSHIGVVRGDETMLGSIVGLLGNQHFPFRAVDDIQPIIWKKTIANSVFNSVCPLLGVDNGIFHRNEKAMAIARRIIRECVGIAHENGILIREDEVAESVLLISKSSDGQQISTWLDIQNKRQTEIGTLNFSIVSLAKSMQKENSVIETNLLGELVLLKSELSL